jgi:DNA-binding protein HU-beta
MNKAQFTDLVKISGAYASKAEAEKAINAVTDSITAALAMRDEVSLVGFGTFATATQKGKSGTVPGTDKKYETSDKIVPKFKAGKTLKDRVELGK